MTKMIAEKAFIRGQDSLKGKKFTSIEEVKKIVADYYWNFVESDEGEAINKASKEIYQLFSPHAPVEGLRGEIAKWLFTMKYRMPNQRFYHSWHDEISASPLTEKEYLNLANELIALLSTHIDQIAREKGYVKLEDILKAREVEKALYLFRLEEFEERHPSVKKFESWKDLKKSMQVGGK